jgi:tRNA(Ile)-lysidine synthase
MRLLLVHVDHRLRAESGEDAAKAVDLAAALDIECQVLAAPTVPTEIHLGVGMEEAARRERYRLLFAAADEAGARAVATGHHEQDQAETVLLHLLRGGGLQGAVGMGERTAGPIIRRPPSDISPEISRLWLWRPLLREARSEIDAYVAQLGLGWVEDSSNVDLGPRRNVVRHQVIPLLEAEFPGATAALARYASLAAADDEVLEQIVQSALAGEVDPGGRLRVSALSGRPLAVQRRMIRSWFGNCTGSRELTAQRTDAILDLVSHGRGNRTVEAGGGWSVSLHEGLLRARRDTDEKEAE